MTDYPQGNGHPNCPVCKGRGDIPVETSGPPAVQSCKCVMVYKTIQNMDRAWKGLASTPDPVKSTPLAAYGEQNLWLTAKWKSLRQHLWRFAFAVGPFYHWRVESDNDLATAWLATVKLRGEAYDADVITSPIKHLTLEDLALPPDLLIIYLGVKAARNSAMPEVLLEAIQTRLFENKPTWVVDQPSQPFEPGHIAFSEIASEIFSEWPALDLTDDAPERAAPRRSAPASLEKPAKALTAPTRGSSFNTDVLEAATGISRIRGSESPLDKLLSNQARTPGKPKGGRSK